MKLQTIMQVLTERGLSEIEANNTVLKAKNEIESGMDAEDVLWDNFQLEIDYIHSL